MPEAGQSQGGSQGNMVEPSIAQSDDQLLWSLGIPVYSDGRVEGERVARVYREVLYPALARAKEESLQLQRASQAEEDFRRMLGGLISRLQEVADRLERQEDGLAARASALAAAEDTLADRGAKLEEQVQRCAVMLAEAKQTLAKAQQAVRAIEQMNDLLANGKRLVDRISEAVQETRHSAAICSRARQALNLAIATEEQTRQAALRASEELRAAAESMPRELAESRTQQSERANSSKLWYAAQRTSPTRREARHWADGRDGRVEVQLAEDVLLPEDRLQLKRRLQSILGTTKVQDAANGRDLWLHCQKGEVELAIAAAKEAAVDLDLEVRIAVVAEQMSEPAVDGDGAEDEGGEPAGILTIIDLRGIDRSQWPGLAEEDSLLDEDDDE